jgi:hypothetical protein
MGIRVDIKVDILLLDQISAPPHGVKLPSAIRRVAIFRVMMDGQSGTRLLWEGESNSNDQPLYLDAALLREARAVAPRAPSLLRICVHKRIAAPQNSY